MRHHEQRFDIDGSQVRVLNAVAEHEQPPLVLFNGIGAGVDHWGSFPEALQRILQRKVIAIDVSGARRLGSVATMRNHARAAIEVMDEVDDSPADALGYSWGGLLLQQAALDYPERFNRVVLAATMPGWQCGIPSIDAMRGLRSANRSHKYLERIAGNMYGGDIQKDPELIVKLGLARDINPVTYRQQQRAARSCFSILFRLPFLNHPSLIMAGGGDPIAPSPNAEVLYNRIPHSQLHVTENGGHAFLLTRPEESAQVINQFLDPTVVKLDAVTDKREPVVLSKAA